MKEVAVKTHLIIKDIHSEFNINWCGKIKDTNPMWVDNKPVFVLISPGNGRIELNTWDIKEIERVGKRRATPRGREAITVGKTYVYIKEADKKETLMCIITHNKIKTFAPMYDKVGWK